MQTQLRSKINFLVALPMALVLLFAAWLYSQYGVDKPRIKIGVLQSLSGARATGQAQLVEVVRLAVEEANQSGGLNGRQIEMVVADCRSDAAYCAQQAEKLITEDGVQALFGCGTSICREAVKPVVEKHHHLLFYPIQHEGLEQSRDIIYTGATPNQQIMPAVLWALQQQRRRFYLVGSDYIFPRITNRIAQDILLANGGQVLEERYMPLNAENFSAVADEIARLKPDVILNTLRGDSNRHFFKALHDAGITAAAVPVISTSITEVESQAMGGELMAGHYAVWSYFQSVDSAENREFIARFKRRFGKESVLNDPMEAAYIAVKLWMNAVREVGTPDLFVVKTVLGQQSMLAPEGIVSVDAENNHLWKAVRIGQAAPDGQFATVWQSEHNVHPAPFPFYRSRAAWASMVQSMQRGVR